MPTWRQRSVCWRWGIAGVDDRSSIVVTRWSVIGATHQELRPFRPANMQTGQVPRWFVPSFLTDNRNADKARPVQPGVGGNVPEIEGIGGVGDNQFIRHGLFAVRLGGVAEYPLVPGRVRTLVNRGSLR